jgi:hypothetical protein
LKGRQPLLLFFSLSPSKEGCARLLLRLALCSLDAYGRGTYPILMVFTGGVPTIPLTLFDKRARLKFQP